MQGSRGLAGGLSECEVVRLSMSFKLACKFKVKSLAKSYELSLITVYDSPALLEALGDSLYVGLGFLVKPLSIIVSQTRVWKPNCGNPDRIVDIGTS